MYRGFKILWSSVFEVVGGRPDLAENADGRVYARTEPGAGFRVGILVNLHPFTCGGYHRPGHLLFILDVLDSETHQSECLQLMATIIPVVRCSRSTHSTILSPRVHSSYLRSETRFLRRNCRGCVCSEPVGVCPPGGTHSGPCMLSFRLGMAALTVGQPFDTGSFAMVLFHLAGR